MQIHPKLGKVGQIFINIIEIYVPLTSFSIMFLVFILQVFFRYVLNWPLAWPYEITIFGFIWTTLLGACYVRRKNAHVSFGLVYENVSPTMRLMFRLIANALILIAFTVPVYATFQYFVFIHIEKSPVLRIPFSIAFSPFLVFLLLIIGYSLVDIVRDFQKLLRGET